MTVADMRYLMDAGALDADGRRTGAVKAPADARERFSAASYKNLISFGIFASD